MGDAAQEVVTVRCDYELLYGIWIVFMFIHLWSLVRFAVLLPNVFEPGMI